MSRLPAFFRWPGRGAHGTVSSVPAIGTDLYPTILEMVGAPALPAQHVDGVSLASLVRGGPAPERSALFWHFPHYSNHGMQSPGGAVRQGDYKLLEYFENNTVQLFNLRDDLGEQRDLAREQPERVHQLTALLHNWRRQVSAAMMEPNPDYKARE
jgi:arylsulfatase A-like enzyme